MPMPLIEWITPGKISQESAEYVQKGENKNAKAY